MSGYTPLKIAGNETGLVKYREDFLLPNDAYPLLENAFVWRERIKRKQGYELLGRLRRVYEDLSLGNSDPASPWVFNIWTTLVPPIVPETNAQIQLGSVRININPTPLTGLITSYSRSENCVVVSPLHGLVTGDVISIAGATVVPDTGDNEINGGPYTITFRDANQFFINVNSTTWGLYAGGGSWTCERTLGEILIDQGDGTLATNPVSATVGTINYLTGAVTITNGTLNQPAIINFNYFPGLPVMGLRGRELTAINNEMMVAFDTVYAYKFSSGGDAQEFLPGTTWTGSDSDFFWSTNYWIGDGNLKIFWVTNFVDPIRYTNGQEGTNWVDFTPQINAAAGTLLKALVMLPFRGRLVVFNTLESDGAHPQRIRWAAIGNPFTIVSLIVTTVSVDAWRDDIRGKGGFLDIPTSENIITVGFVRDNLVIYCERSTWQLRYTGRSIAPFQIEKVNTELGVESTFSGVQFDTSLVGIGDKGIVECDSFKSDRIDIKIVDLVITDINNNNNGTKRVHGIRDFQQRLAFWIYPLNSSNGIYPDRRLVYNYESDNWAVFTDSLTALGTFQKLTNRKWNDQPTIKWREANFPWVNRPSLFPSIMGGNQQGYVLYLDEQTTNQQSLSIKGITGNTSTPTSINSPSHNLQTDQIIKIINIPSTSPFATTLNDKVFAVRRTGADDFYIQKYDPATGDFNSGQFDAPGAYVGGGEISIRDNFRIQSKKFNYMDQGKQFQLGYIDVLFDAAPKDSDEIPDSFISLKIFNDYNDDTASNIKPENSSDDTFFNSVVPTNSTDGVNGGNKNWKRVFCPTNSNFVTIEWTLNNEQMTNQCQESDVQIDAQIIWSRVGGRLGITN